jgi:YesN/AraC family two-component response regulator
MTQPLNGNAAELEREALRHLSNSDAENCRRCLGRLVRALPSEGSPADSRRATALMLHLLLTVNRRIHRIRRDEDRFRRTHTELIEQFPAIERPDRARAAFMERLNRMLGTLTDYPLDGHPLVGRARAYIDAHYRERIFLSSVAEALHVSPNYLSRIFRKEVGQTLTAYIQNLRVRDARRLLGHADRSLAEIAYQVGYQNYRDFYRNFVKLEKASPREVRRRMADEGLA